MRRVGRRFGAELLVLGGVGLVVASLVLPWLTATEPILWVDGELTETVQGMGTGDAELAVGAACAAGVLGVVGRWRWYTAGFVSLLGVALVGLGAFYLSDPLRGIETGSTAIRAQVSAGLGLYAVTFGGACIALGAVVGHWRARRADSDGQRSPRAANQQQASGDRRATPQERTDTPDSWVVGVVCGLALFVVTVLAVWVRDDLSGIEGTFLVGLWLLAWVLLPVTTALDLRYVRSETRWQPRWWLWTGLAAVPFGNAVSTGLYLYTRWLAADDRSGSHHPRQRTDADVPRRPGGDPSQTAPDSEETEENR